MAKKPTSRNHKRHRRRAGSLAGTTLPRLSTPAPSPSPPQHAESANTTPNGDSKARPKTAPQPFTDDSELRAQISTLSLIKMYGYGPIPGTPLLRSSNSASSIFVRGGVSRKRLRNDGMNAPDGAMRATSGSGGRDGRGFVRPQEPWMGPMESNVGVREGTAAKARCCGHALLSCIIMRPSKWICQAAIWQSVEMLSLPASYPEGFGTCTRFRPNLLNNTSYCPGQFL